MTKENRIDRNDLLGRVVIWLLDQGSPQDRKALFKELKEWYCFECGGTEGYKCDCWKDESN